MLTEYTITCYEKCCIGGYIYENSISAIPAISNYMNKECTDGNKIGLFELF